MNAGDPADPTSDGPGAPRADAKLTPEQRRNYYRELRRAISLRDLAKRLLGDRITREGEAEILVNCPRHASESGTSLRVDLHQGLWCFLALAKLESMP